MRKKIGLLCMVLVMSLMGATQTFALSDTKKSEITVSHINYDNLSDSEKASIIKDSSEISVTQDVYNIRMIYSKITGGNELPNTGLNSVSPFIFIGVALLAIGLMLLFKKTGKGNLFGLVILGTIIAVGAIGAMNIYADASTLIQDTTLTVTKGEAFTPKPEHIQGYKYLGYIVAAKDNPDEVVEDKEGIVEVHYQDETGNVLANKTQVKGVVNKPFKIEVVDLEGYQFIEFRGNSEGRFTIEKQTVTAIYRKNDSKVGFVTLRYHDTLGNAIKPEMKLTGGIGSVFKVDIPKISNYTFNHIENLGNALFTKEHQVITLVYDKVIKNGNLTVNYQDIDGNTIRPTKIMTGSIGSTYTVSIDMIDGYEFVKFVGNNIGLFTEQQQEVIVQYRKIVSSIGKVTIEYRDETGTPLKPNNVLSGEVGTGFEVDIPEIDGYKFKEISNPGNNTFLVEDQIITITYNKLLTEGTVLVNYHDMLGNQIKDPVTLTGVTGSSYKVEAPIIDGYQFKEFQGNFEGTFTASNQEVTVVYDKAVKYMTTVVKFKHVQNGYPTKDFIAVPDLSRYQAEVIDFSNYYLKFNEPITNRTVVVKYGEELESVTLSNWEFNINDLPKEVQLNTFYLDENGVEKESFGSYSQSQNGYIGDGSTEYGGFVDFKASLAETPIITYDENSKTVYVTYTCMYIPVIIDF
ncbi:MucBP domain-containing protein [Erysipelothrix inopinata]|uniref:MucBP domain-containing protein n=1 Tax=Erysipelothrix inopinata TaxID=225084 RepID=A0A7G9RXN4_9FIRM|nr:MucBP domain-containing protein [Erysipelothrix inopinata]QNN60359.1 MucBP domain-containing protein [Erysipelothrix inopinata]